jgi:hypothetical protein
MYFDQYRNLFKIISKHSEYETAKGEKSHSVNVPLLTKMEKYVYNIKK